MASVNRVADSMISSKKSLIVLLALAVITVSCKKHESHSDAISQGWRYSRKLDKMSDKPGYKAITTDKSNNSIIQIGCDGVGPGSIYMSFITRHTFLGDGERLYEWRVDKQESKSTLATYDKNSASLFNHEEAFKFISSLSHGTALSIRAETYELEPVEITFQIDGTDAMYEKLKTDCQD